MADLLLPSLGPDMESGTVLEWRVGPGDRVQKGDIVAVVDTEKAALDIESFLTGRVEALLVAPGTKVPVGTALARIKLEDAPAATELLRDSSVEERVSSEAPLPVHHSSERATAEERGERADRMRAAVARSMSRSNRDIPHYFVSADVDISPLATWLDGYNGIRGATDRMVMSAPLLKATALALRRVPELNGTWSEGRLKRSESLNLGVVVSLRGGGLLVPTLCEVDRLPTATLMATLREVVRRARSNTLRASDLAEASFTVTSLVDSAADQVWGTIFPPQVALVGFGRARSSPRWIDESVVSRQCVTVTLAADHRATDGHVGARFLDALGRLLEEPERL